MDDKRLRRAGLDYHEWAEVSEHRSLAEFESAVGPPRLFACSTRGERDYTQVSFQPGDALLFGPETRGLPQPVIDRLPRERCLRIPMLPNSRSLNLSNAVAVMVYEAWRQAGFVGAAKPSGV